MNADAGTSAGLEVDVDIPGRLRARLAAPAGSVVGVVGPNGAGKSTLLQAVAGILPGCGRVVAGGEDWSDLLIRHRRVGMVFQNQSLFPHLNARENVAFGPRSRGTSRREARALADSWLERLGLGDLGRRRPGQLSGGQAQRVAIARALACEPTVLLLDEPFAGLDVSVAARLRVDLAEHLARFEGVALLVTHDALDALTLAGRMLVIDDGRVVQQGPPAEVSARPATTHVARLVGLNLVRDGDRLAAFRPSDVHLSHGEPDSSARHRWHAEVVGLTGHGDVVRVQTETAGGLRLLADVTPASVAHLRLAPGTEVWLSAKETGLTWYPAPESDH